MSLTWAKENTNFKSSQKVDLLYHYKLVHYSFQGEVEIFPQLFMDKDLEVHILQVKKSIEVILADERQNTCSIFNLINWMKALTGERLVTGLQPHPLVAYNHSNHIVV